MPLIRNLAVLSCLILAACPGFGTPQSPQVETIITIAQACDAYAYALESITPFRQSLSVEADQTVLRLTAGVAGVCGPGAPPPASPADAVALVSASASRVLAMIAAERR